MTLSKEQLENIQKYASIYLPVSDIALLIDVHADELPFLGFKINP